MAIQDPMAPTDATTDPTKQTIKPPAAPATNPIPTAGATATAPATSPTPTSPTPTPLGAVDPMAFAPPPPIAPSPASPGTSFAGSGLQLTPPPNGGSTAAIPYEQTAAGKGLEPTVAPTLGPSGMSNDFLAGRVAGGDADPYINQEYQRSIGQPLSGPEIQNLAPKSGEQFTLKDGGQYRAVERNGVWQNADGTPLGNLDQYGNSTFTGTGMQPSMVNGAANPNVGQPSVGAPAAMAPGAANVNRISTQSGVAPTQSGQGGIADLLKGAPFSTATTQPGSDLRSQTITANSGLDRMGLAQKMIENLRAQSEPQFQKTQRDLTQNAAANGQTGSGMFRTSLGDAARQHELDLQNGDLGFLSDALKGSVDDNRFATGVAQQQQGFQEGQQQSAFGQSFAQQQLQEALKNGDFQRALQMLGAGNQGNPADIEMMLSQIFGNQASAAGNALGGAIQGRQQNSSSASDANIYQQILQQLYGKGAGTSSGSFDPSLAGS